MGAMRLPERGRGSKEKRGIKERKKDEV